MTLGGFYAYYHSGHAVTCLTEYKACCVNMRVSMENKGFV